MKRYYDQILSDHLKKYRQMFFLAGPRQVGKTTCAINLEKTTSDFFYFNWDYVPHRRLILDLKELDKELRLSELKEKGKQIVVFDEIHKYADWKQFLKGFFDLYEKKLKIVVTGSAKLDVYKKGGDSLMGRYFIHRMHPLSIAELISPSLPKSELNEPSAIKSEDWEKLFKFGGFPEPFKESEETFYEKWSKSRLKQLFEEDVRDLSNVLDLDRIELLAEILRYQVGQLTSYNELAKKIGVSIPTIKNWISILRSVFYCYTIQPWSTNIPRSLLKEPKYFLWDWSLVPDKGARIENLIASHLLKSVHMWTDRGLGDFGLYYLRDKQKHEVDFIVTKNKKPWFLVETKKSPNKGISKSLIYFKKITAAAHAFQVVYEMDYVNRDCFEFNEPIIVPARTLLSQLL